MPADRVARLAQHAHARHEQTRQRAQAALSAMVRDGAPVTIASLAARARLELAIRRSRSCGPRTSSYGRTSQTPTASSAQQPPAP
jgi:hypothetical protein